MTPILGGTWVLVDLVAMSSVPTRHCHFGCTSDVGFDCLVHLLDGGLPIRCIFMVACCTSLGNCPIRVDVHCMRAYVFKDFADLFYGGRHLSLSGRGVRCILCCAMVGIPSTLVLLVVVPTN